MAGVPVPVPLIGIDSARYPLLPGVQVARVPGAQILLLAAVSAKVIWPVTAPATSGLKPNVKVHTSPAVIVKLGTAYDGKVVCGKALAAQLALERENWCRYA